MLLIPSVGSLNTTAPCGVPSVEGEGIRVREQSHQEQYNKEVFSPRDRNIRHERAEGPWVESIMISNQSDKHLTASEISPHLGITTFVLFTQ